jgi:hypothetical protein
MSGSVMMMSGVRASRTERAGVVVGLGAFIGVFRVRHRVAGLYFSSPLILMKTSSRCPLSPGRGCRAAQSVGVLLTELHTPATDGLVGDGHTAPEHQLLDLAERQAESGSTATRSENVSENSVMASV